jgi:membrane associated rhomboid family serine protease
MVLAGLGVASFRTSDLLNWGANYSLLVRQGQWFRLVTSMFVHGGLFHLAMNTYGLLFAGLFLESMLGTGKFAFAYLFTGIAASIVSILVHPNTVTLGASGAIFGLYGVLLVLLFVKDFGRALTKDPLLMNVAIFIGVNLLIGSLAIGIDNAAHVGGLLSGILLGAFFCLVVSNARGHRSIMMASRQVRAKTSTLPR